MHNELNNRIEALEREVKELRASRDGYVKQAVAREAEAERKIAELEAELNANRKGRKNYKSLWEVAEADKARLSEALRPFAAVSSLFGHMNDDGGSVLVNVRLGDLRAASAALSDEVTR